MLDVYSVYIDITDNITEYVLQILGFSLKNVTTMDVIDFRFVISQLIKYVEQFSLSVFLLSVRVSR